MIKTERREENPLKIPPVEHVCCKLKLEIAHSQASQHFIGKSHQHQHKMCINIDIQITRNEMKCAKITFQNVAALHSLFLSSNKFHLHTYIHVHDHEKRINSTGGEMKKKVGIKSSFEFKIRFHVAAVSSLQIQYAHSSALETRAFSRCTFSRYQQIHSARKHAKTGARGPFVQLIKNHQKL